jgi:hypothetical protein
MAFYTFQVITQWATYIIGVAASTQDKATELAQAECSSARKEDIKHSIMIHSSERPGVRYSLTIENESYNG